jgi:DegV family protein with EDD domain
VYEEAAQETDEIVSIHVSSKLSATYDAAMVGKEIAKTKGCRIEVIDSKGLAMWQGLVVIAAAKAAEAGYSLNQVVDRVREAIGEMRGLALLDTVRYAVKGGRLGKVVSAMESVLHVKLLLTLRDGEIRTAGLVRTRRKGIDRLLEFTRSASHIEDLAVVYSTTSDDAQTIADYISSLFPNIVPRIVRLGPALCVHFGPGVLGTVLREAK